MLTVRYKNTSVHSELGNIFNLLQLLINLKKMEIIGYISISNNLDVRS